MPALRCELGDHIGSVHNILSDSSISSHVTTSLETKRDPFIKSSTIMERHKLDALEPAELEPVNSKLSSSDKNINKSELEIEVLDFDQCGILSDSEEINTDNGNFSNSVNGYLNNESSEEIYSSDVKSDENTSLNTKTNDNSCVKSPARLQIRNYKCNHCGFSTQNSRKYLYHLQNVHEEKFVIHECSNCEYASKHIKNLQRHFDVIHGEKREYVSLSTKKLSKKSFTRLPKKSKLKKNSETFQCDLCSFNTTSKRIFNNHVTFHDQPTKEISDINSNSYSTEYNGIEDNKSDFLSSSNENFELVDPSSTRPQKSHKCPLCKMNIRYISWLIRHFRNNHRGNIQAERLACAYEKKKRKKRPNSTGWEILKNIQNETKKRNQRVSSSVSQSGQMKLDNFLSVSTTSTESLPNNYEKIPHRKYSDSSVRCNICYCKFKGMLELREHMQVHATSSSSDFDMNSSMKKQFEAYDDVSANHNVSIIPMVGKQSTVLKNVRNELRSKISNMKYKCPYCSFSIRSVSRFHIHFIQHMKNLQFRCSDCDYHSNWKWTVVKHIWSRVRHERNHFNASVLTNNELVDLNSFKLYKRYLVNQSKSDNSQLNASQTNVVQGNLNGWFQSAKPNPLYDDTNIVDSPIQTVTTPNLLSLNVSNSLRETNYYYCKECNFSSVSKQIVINHLASHAGIKPFQCSVCHYKSNWKHVIIRHMKNIHAGHNKVIEQKINYVQEGYVLSRKSVTVNNYEYPGFVSKHVFSCRICPYTTYKKYHMNFHMKQHKRREGANYKCDKCPYFVKFAKSLKRHKTLHEVGRKGYLNIDNCAQESVSSVQVEQFPKKYFRKKSLACTKCPARFSQLNRFNRHLQLHGKDHRFKCNLCDYSVLCAANLVKHKKLHEMKLESPVCSKTFSCPICPSVFTLKHKYVRHLKFHNRNCNNQSGSSVQANASIIKSRKLHYIKKKSEYFNFSKSLKCPKCPTMFASQERYTRHLELHGKNLKFKCSHCDFSVQNAVNILRHERLHTRKSPEVQDPIYPENLNGMVKVEESVAVDPVIVTNERKLFICDRCPYYSGSKSAVQNHQRSHWFKQSFECPHCDYSSMQRSSLQSHLKLHLEGSKLFPPEAFMKFQSFKIIVQEESGEKLVFDDEAMVNKKRKKIYIDDESLIENTVETIQNNSVKYSELQQIDENNDSDKDPIVVLTDIFDKNNFL